ncbi:hypothetical protein TREMEDRAFT_20069, partial [Tremella mesenterica DSM 1558]|uniref:uncharacterized protein n=1 Tax=Tremella mesenterica (strain ATCC 24925 / CBS 8224 / DSM 1558 / NBRC 9311 / NRRL Y-6157 / RJB 2259-6 / UBC 559-6) TaxID=578456 RepID=UPI0003F49CE3
PKNYTIDDSQWSTPALSLSTGWNMLRNGGANEYINATQVAVMQPLLGNFWNQSVSWTTTQGSEVTMDFVGTDFYAYGPTGPSYGRFSVSLDNITLGTYTS